MKRGFVVAALLALVAGQAGAATLIGGFNGGLGAWVDTDGASVSIVTSAPMGSNTLNPTEGTHFVITDYGGVHTSPGLISAGYWLSFDYATNSTWTNWSVSKPTAPFTTVNGAFGDTNGHWAHASVDLSSLAGISNAVIDFYGGPFALDNVTLGTVPEPSSVLALAGGLGSLVLLRRRRG